VYICQWLATDVNREQTHFNYSEKKTGGGERGLGWYHARRLLRKIQGIDCRVQRGERAVPPLWSL